MPVGSVISIERAADPLGAATSDGVNPYVLTVQLVQPVVTPTPALPPDGKAYVGDTATVLVDGVAQGRVTLEERGAIYRLDIPNPAKTPSPNANLVPVRVLPTPPTLGPTFTRTATPTGGTPSPSSTRTASPSPTGTPTRTPTPDFSACGGNCDGDQHVTVDELVRIVGISLEGDGVDACEIADGDGSGAISLAEILTAVDNALGGCR